MGVYVWDANVVPPWFLDGPFMVSSLSPEMCWNRTVKGGKGIVLGLGRTGGFITSNKRVHLFSM